MAIVRLDVLQWSRTRMKWRNYSLIGERHITPLVPSSSTRNRSTVTEFDGIDAVRPSGTRSDFEQSSTSGRTSSCGIRTGCLLQPNYGSQNPCFRHTSVHTAACTAVQNQVRTNNVHISVAVNGRFPLSFCFLLYLFQKENTIRYDTRCCFNVRSKADMSRLNLPHGDDN